MRNLRKYFAVFVAVAMLVTAMAPVFAADTATTATPAPAALTDAKVVETLGMLKGEGGTVSEDYLKTTVTRLQAAIMALRLKGLESAALAFTGKENFADADKVEWDGGKAILAYLKANKDLGWQGDGTNFDPNATISAQDYYKTLLVSLGYVEGKDFQYADTLKFAESKGLKAAAKAETFTINDVAVSTVEALKATMNGKTATLLTTLVDAKAIDTAKAQAAGLMSTVASSFALTNGAKALTVKFDVAPVDATKVVFTTTRDGVALTAAFTQDAADKAKFVYATSTNLVTGEYKVAVKNDTADLGSKTVKIENEKIAKIEFAGKLVNRRDDVSGISYYKVTNQYGEDVTKNSIAANITWNSSLGKGSNGADISGDKGVITISKDDTASTYMNKLKDYTTVVVTAYDVDSNVSMSETLSVSTTVGDMQSVKLLGISNVDKKTVIEKGKSDVFYVDYEIKDSLGNLVTDYRILSNTNAFKLSPGAAGESSVIYAEVVADPNDNKKALIQLKQPTTPNTGTQVISAYSIGSGKSANLNVEVKEGASLTQFILSRPVTEVAQGDGLTEIPFTALDGNGKQLTMYSDIKISGLNITVPSPARKYEVRNPDGTYKLMIDFGSSKTTYTVTATVNTTTTVKMSTMNVSVKDAAYPYDITAINTADCPAGAVYDAAYNAAVSVAADKLTVTDQYGRAVNFKHAFNFADNGLIADSGAISAATTAAVPVPGATAAANTAAVTAVASTKYYTGKDGFIYYVAMSSNDQSVMTIPSLYNNGGTVVANVYTLGTGATAKTYGIISGTLAAAFAPYNTVDGNGTKSTSITFSLRKMKDNAKTDTYSNMFNPTNYTEVDSWSYTVYNVDRKDITKYEFDAITANLYATSTVTTYEAATNAQQAWELETKLRGYYNGTVRTLLPFSDHTLYSVNDPTKIAFKLTLNNDGSTNYGYQTNQKIIAKGLAATDPTTVKTVLSGTVKGYNNSYVSTTKEITIDQTAPAAASITVGRTDFSPVMSVGGDYYKITAAKFLTDIVNTKPMTKFNQTTGAGANGSRAALWFAVKDQYGKEGSKPQQILVARTDENGVAVAAPAITATGALDMTGVPTVASTTGDDYFMFTIIAANGVTKTVTLIVQ